MAIPRELSPLPVHLPPLSFLLHCLSPTTRAFSTYRHKIKDSLNIFSEMADVFPDTTPRVSKAEVEAILGPWQTLP